MTGVAGPVQDADDDVADGGEQAGRLPGAQLGGVFAEGCVAPVVQAVLDAPVLAVACQQERRAGLGGGQRGDGQYGLGLQFRAACGGAGQRVVVAGVAAVLAAGAPPCGSSCR